MVIMAQITQQTPGVICRPVPGYDDLYAGTDASIVHPKVGILPQKLYGRHRYLEVHIPYTGARTTHVHVLVAAAFFGPRAPGMEVRHGEAGRFDNTPGNLCYGTSKDNSLDAIRDGTHSSLIGKSKTHCPQNHEYTQENTYTPPGTVYRKCRACATQAAAKAEENRGPRNRPKRQGPKVNRNALKTHCPSEHEYTNENTYIAPNGSRQCKTCRDDRQSSSVLGVGRGRKLNLEQKAQIREMLLLSPRPRDTHIAKMVGVTPGTIATYRKRIDLQHNELGAD